MVLDHLGQLCDKTMHSVLNDNRSIRTAQTCSIWPDNGAKLLERPYRLLSLVRLEVIQLNVFQSSRHADEGPDKPGTGCTKQI